MGAGGSRGLNENLAVMGAAVYESMETLDRSDYGIGVTMENSQAGKVGENENR
jgi:hypothetical protein